MSPYLILFLIFFAPIFVLTIVAMGDMASEGHPQSTTAGLVVSSAFQASLIAGVLTGIGALISIVTPW